MKPQRTGFFNAISGDPIQCCLCIVITSGEQQLQRVDWWSNIRHSRTQYGHGAVQSFIIFRQSQILYVLIDDFIEKNFDPWWFFFVTEVLFKGGNSHVRWVGCFKYHLWGSFLLLFVYYYNFRMIAMVFTGLVIKHSLFQFTIAFPEPSCFCESFPLNPYSSFN